MPKLVGEPRACGDAEYELAIRTFRSLESGSQSALATLQTSADHGSPISMLLLGSAYRDGVGTEIDLREAEEWYRRAATAGLIHAWYTLGRLLQEQKRYAESKLAFEHVAERGFMPAVHQLGRVYYFGFGVAADRDQGRILLQRAADWGCVFAKALVAYDQISHASGSRESLRGLMMKLSCYIDLVVVLCTEGFTSDKLR